MSQSLSKITLHLVFSTSCRQNLIPTEALQDVHAYIAGLLRGLGSEAYRVGGAEDHVHIACTLPRTMTTSQLVQEVKASSSKWVKERTGQAVFSWQSGYGAFSLGHSQLGSLIRYIENQQEHHQKVSFEKELIAFLSKYRIDYDEKYLWD